MEQQLKEQEISVGIDKPQTDLSNQIYIDDLKNLIKTNTEVPTHTPKKFVDMFYLRDNSGTNEIYIFINNSWEKIF